MIFCVLIFGGSWWLRAHRSFFQLPVTIETLSTEFPSDLDREGSNWTTLTFGYHLGPWPLQFKGDPIIMSLEYQKGPPLKFIPKMKQIWSPGEAELTIEGPRTPIPNFDEVRWKACLMSYAFCLSEKQKLVIGSLKDFEIYKKQIRSFTWFEGPGAFSARGLHIKVELENDWIDRYIVFTDHGNSQNFTLKTAKNDTGQAARDLFLKVLGNMTVKSDLTEPRTWILKQLQGVQLEKVRTITDAKLRYEQWILVQNMLMSELAVDPRSIAPYFHLAGVVHLMSVSLIKEKKTYFKNQESWLIGTHAWLLALIQFVKDFPDTEETKAEKSAALANMESLLEDFLLVKQKSSK